MGDPVTMAMVGASVGAMMNKKDPLKGAMLGAAGGFGGATLLAGGAAAGGAAAGGTAAGASALPGVAGGSVAQGAFGAPASAITAANTVAPSAGIFANPTSALGGVSQNFVSGPSTGLINSSLVPPPTFMDKVSAGLSDVGQFTKDYPVATQMAFSTGQNLLQQREPQVQSAGLMRGSPMQAQIPQYQIGVPKISLI